MIKVNDGNKTFWVKDKKKIEFYKRLNNHPHMTIKILKEVKEPKVI